jgi:hypothetical protein
MHPTTTPRNRLGNAAGIGDKLEHTVDELAETDAEFQTVQQDAQSTHAPTHLSYGLEIRSVLLDTGVRANHPVRIVWCCIFQLRWSGSLDSSRCLVLISFQLL